ncbi:uncharacterized protein BDW43DRAFT_258018 [Aspergillus alliaceus]|uniref:uncharacterized protein n=1 Tax=Petromyces alliaceus TaxID=209559 RepID=UPI0012A61687|nr:uncharacterized protein BDW43DRAFT_258018 [Aspergillus alliaceus]KAB8239426.1 hypothetical protein BDW43DRAFT_258018 [Aspergillus alliaceus]
MNRVVQNLLFCLEVLPRPFILRIWGWEKSGSSLVSSSFILILLLLFPFSIVPLITLVFFVSTPYRREPESPEPVSLSRLRL